MFKKTALFFRDGFLKKGGSQKEKVNFPKFYQFFLVLPLTRQIESLLLRLKDFISAIVQAVGKFANFDAYTD